MKWGLVRIIYIRKLHYEEAKQKFLTELDNAFFSGEPEVEVIHGVGTYTLRNMVLEQIKKISYVELSNNWNHNPGSLKLTLLVPEMSLLKKYKEDGQKR